MPNRSKPDVAEGDALGGGGIVLNHKAVIPSAGEAVRHYMIRAGLESEAIAVLPPGNDFDIADFHMLGGKGIAHTCGGITSTTCVLRMRMVR